MRDLPTGIFPSHNEQRIEALNNGLNDPYWNISLIRQIAKVCYLKTFRLPSIRLTIYFHAVLAAQSICRTASTAHKTLANGYNGWHH